MEIKFAHLDRLTTLAMRMKKGDRKAAEALYTELMPKTYGFFFARVGKREIAEDLSQEIFLKLVEKIGSFDESRGRFTVWFWQMARNALVDHYRAKKEAVFSGFDDEVVASFAIAEIPPLDEKMLHDSLKLFLKTLAAEEQELFELRYVAELSYREIAPMLGKSESSLRVMAFRLKEKMKKAFVETV